MELIKNRIRQYKELASVSKDHEENIDVIVPDISPDVQSILYTTGACSVREKQVGTGSVTVTGDIFIKVIYTSEEAARLYTLMGQIPFSYSYEAPSAQSGDMAALNARVLSAGAMMLNPRKLALKAELGVDIRLFQPAEIEIVEGAVGEPGEGIQTRMANESFDYLGAIAEKKIAFNEEIRLMAGNIGEHDRLARSDLVWMCEDVRVLDKKIMLRGNAVVKIITLPAGQRAAVENTYKLPFSQIIEREGVCAEDSVAIDFQTFQFEAQLVTRGENELYLYCNVFGTALAFVHKTAQLTLLEDIYSTAYDMSFDTAEVALGVGETTVITADASGLIELECPAAKVLDHTWCARARSTPDGIMGSYYFKILYESQDGRVCSASRRIDVEAAATGLCPGSCVKAGAESIVIGVDAAGSIQINFRAVFEPRAVCGSPRRQIKSCRLNKEKPVGKARDASLVLRAIEEGESVWGIAKQYRTAPEAILSANRLADAEALTAGKLVIIPFVQ